MFSDWPSGDIIGSIGSVVSEESGHESLREGQSARTYSTFISYRHADNRDEGRRWAEWLHQMLETYEVPQDLVGQPSDRGTSIPSTLYPVFRDEVELPANAELAAPIRRALENSNTLIVVCSPRAVASRFVAEEIRIFKELGKSDRILALIVDGEPNADDPAKRAAGIAAESECFPEPLRFGRARLPSSGASREATHNAPDIDWSVRTEPIAADVRPAGRVEQGWTSANFYRAALESTGDYSATESRRLQRGYAARLELARLKLIAGVVGIALGRLTKRDAVYRAQKFRRLASIFGVLAAVAVAAGAIALWQRERAEHLATVADESRARAEEAKNSAVEAERQTRLRASKADADVALALSQQGDDANAFAHTVRAIELNPENQLAALLAYRLLTDGRLPLPTHLLTHESIVSSLIFSPNGRFIASGCDDGSVMVTNLSTRQSFLLAQRLDRKVQQLAFSPDSQSLAIATDKKIVSWAFGSGASPVLVTDKFVFDVLDLAWPVLNRIVAHTGRDWGSHARLTQVLTSTATGWELVFAIGDDLGIQNAEIEPAPGRSVIEVQYFETWVARGTGLLAIHNRAARRLVWLDLKGKLDVEAPAYSTPVAEGLMVEVATDSGVALIGSNFADRNSWKRRGPEAAPSEDRTALRWLDPRSGRSTELQVPDGYAVEAISPDGEHFLYSTPRGTALMNGRSGKLLLEHFWKNEGYSDLFAVRRDGRSWLLRPRQIERRNKLQMASTANGANLNEAMLALPAEVLLAEFDAAGQQLAVATGDQNVRVWSIPQVERPPLSVRAPEPRGQRVGPPPERGQPYDLDPDKQVISRLDPATNRNSFVSKLQKPDDDNNDVTGTSFSPDGRRLAITYGSTSDRPDNNEPSVAILYDVATGRRIGTPLQHDDDVFSPVFSPDGEWLFTACDDGTVRRWRAATAEAAGQPIRLPERVRHIDVSPKGDFIVTATGHMIDVQKWQVTKILTPAPGMPVATAHFSSDGLWLATVSSVFHKTGDTDQDVEYRLLNQWELQTASRIAMPIQAPSAVSEVSESWRDSAFGTSTWECTLPGSAARLLPVLRALSPITFDEAGDKVVNVQCAATSVSLVNLFPQGSTSENEVEYEFAKLLLENVEAVRPSPLARATSDATRAPASRVVPPTAPAPTPPPTKFGDSKTEAALAETEADQQLNLAYTALRKSLLQSAKQALKREQIDWLKRRDTIRDPAARVQFIKDRTAELQAKVGKAR